MRSAPRLLVLGLVFAFVAGCSGDDLPRPNGEAVQDDNGLPRFQFDGGGGWQHLDLAISEPQDPPPEYGPTVTAQVAPPPVSGGTLLILKNGTTAVAADPDRDRVSIVDLAQRKVVATVELSVGDEPGRMVEDGAGRVHVALRRGGAIVDLDVAKGTVIARRPVCGAPRGVAWEVNANALHVACADGRLVTLAAAGGGATRTLQLDRDLRDVIVDGDRLLVSRFRSAQLLVVDAHGVITGRLTPPNFSSPSVRSGAIFEPAVAWRTIAHPVAGAVMVHQRGLFDEVVPVAGGYGQGPTSGPCASSIVHAAVSRLAPKTQLQDAPFLPAAVLPVDLALSPKGDEFAVVAAGNARNRGMRQLFVGALAAIGDCHGAADQIAGRPVAQPIGQPIAVAFDGAGEVVVQTREPATLQVLSGNQATIPLAGALRVDTGHDIFHGNSGGSLACASCHPEGGDDGRVWRFDRLGPRRTQSLRGSVIGSEPFHWEGDMKDLTDLLGEVFQRRMRGPFLAADQIASLSHWLESIPDLPPPETDPAAAERGAKLFANPGIGCAGCHSGPRLTNGATVDVGTGGAFQVPALRGLVYRAPYLHDGRAADLRDRFGLRGGGDQHGATSKLSDAQVSDLLAHLERL